jgi:RNA polymerase sigma factor (sigma-70 family)
VANRQLRSVIRQLRHIVCSQKGACALTDSQLIEAFIHHRDEAAVEILIWRHGAMVLNLCRRILRDEHQAEDAFQAAFLVFIRKAGSISKRQSIGTWLYKVACRVAYQLRAGLAKQPKQRAEVDDLDDLPGREPADDLIWRDLRPVLDEYIDRLPEKYRAPIVLCYLQGQTIEETAELLRCSKRTIQYRVARGRELLKSSLTRRGLALSAGWLATRLSVNVSSAAVPPMLGVSTVKAAIEFATGKEVSGLVSTSVITLTQGVLRTMFITKLTKAVAILIAVAVLGIAAGSVAQWSLADSNRSREEALDLASNVPPPQQKDGSKRASRENNEADPQEKGKVDPAGAPLDARLVAKQKTYTLDRGGKTPDEYAQLIEAASEAAEKGGGPRSLLATPQVDLILELHNTSDKEIRVLIGGDPTTLILDLKGPGTVNITPNYGRDGRPSQTAEFRNVEPTAIAPGKKVELPITCLAYGFRGNGSFTYWIKSGDYTLTAIYHTAIAPSPKGAKEENNVLDREKGFGRVAVTSAPIKLTVEEKK